MKTIIFISSFFFFLGVKVGNLFEMKRNSQSIDKIITNKIIQSKPAKSFQLFISPEENHNKEEEKLQEAESDSLPTTEKASDK